MFNLIAPVYGFFYHSQKKNFHQIITKNKNNLDISSYRNIVDVGCGTGALCSALLNEDILVTGVEPALNMLNIGAKKTENKDVTFIQGSTEKGLIFEDKSFDLSITSYVAHGLYLEQRIKLYKEMSRITKHFVILHDYNQSRSVWTNIIEWAERGDYFNFIKNVDKELKENFKSVRVVSVGNKASWYICEPL